MTNLKTLKIKKALRNLGVAAVGSSAVLPVLSCAQEITIVIPDGYEKTITETIATPDGIKHLPVSTPEGTHWEYQVDDGAFSPAPPTDMNPGQKVVTKLVADEGVLDDEVDVTTTVVAIVDVPSNLQSTLEATTLLPNQAEPVIPAAPEHTHWEYQVSGLQEWLVDLGAVELQAGDQVLVKLVADEDYELSREITTELVIPHSVEISQALLDQFATVYAVAHSTAPLTNLPSAPEHTHWEYNLGSWHSGEYLAYDGDYLVNVVLRVGDVLKIRLVAAPDYVLSEPVTNLDVPIVNIEVPFAELATRFAKTTIDLTTGITNLPPPPANTHYRYAVQHGTTYSPLRDYRATLPPTLVPGDHVAFLLVADDGTLLSEDSELYPVLVTKTIPTSSLPKALAQTTIDARRGISNLPAAPEHTHWEFQVDDGSLSADLPPVFEVGQKLGIELVAAPNYLLSHPVSRLNLVVRELLDVTTIASELANISVDQKTGITGLPPAPNHTFWEYQIENEAVTKNFPSNLQTGQQVTVQLVAEPNYHLKTPVRKTTVVKQHVVVVPAEKQGHLDRDLEFPINQPIAWMPSAPTDSHWEFSLNGADFISQNPTLGTEFYDGTTIFDVVIKLVVNDPIDVLSTPVSRKIRAPGIVSTAGYQADLDRGYMGYPPYHAAWYRDNSSDKGLFMIPLDGWILDRAVQENW